ncbi:hypothetical protein PRUPE_3G084700 [Prunus persica]|uniref:Secreted protein n=1 Tax=Prunus persica TaxID=3760 RepID=A0A251PXB0_PRUPE|nr:hypothetical protein PRUPE_3G084700 [Prunus persica]
MCFYLLFFPSPGLVAAVGTLTVDAYATSYYSWSHSKNNNSQPTESGGDVEEHGHVLATGGHIGHCRALRRTRKPASVEEREREREREREELKGWYQLI